MSKKKRQHRRMQRKRQRPTPSAEDLSNPLEDLLNRFDASTLDLPDLDRGSATSQEQHAEGVQARLMFLVRTIRDIIRAYPDHTEKHVHAFLIQVIDFNDPVIWIELYRCYRQD